jgi:hypothetical protein
MRSTVAILDPRPSKSLDRIETAARDVLAIDLVALTVMAVNRLAPATLRSATYGKAHKVVVSDELTGAVFRAALEQMRLQRSTDRLIEVVVEDHSGSETSRSG